MEYPLVSASGDVEGVRLDPGKLAGQLLPIVESFSKVLEANQRFKLESLDLGLAISGSGSIGFVTFGAEASISLHFVP